MSPKLRLLKPLFLLGFALPYLHLAFTTDYISYLRLLFTSIYSIGPATGPAVFGIVLIALYMAKPLLQRKGWFHGLFIFSIIDLMFIPSVLFMVAIFLFKGLLDFGSKMYLAGLTVALIIAPGLLFLSQAEHVVSLKGGVALPATMTLVAYATLSLLAGISEHQPTDLSSLGMDLFHTLALASSFTGSGRRAWAPFELAMAAVFTITSALYFYYRLNNPKDELEDPTRPEFVVLGSFFSIALVVLLAIVLNLGIVLLDRSVSFQPIPFSIPLITAPLILLLTLPRG
ncbi:MAG: hypothetical protein QW815_03580 [Nitrososphaerota archaeon]